MIKKTLLFSNPCYLNTRHQQLQVNYPDDTKPSKTVPIEDIGIIVLEHPQITISTRLMTLLLAQQAAVIHCDERHHPIGLLLPLEGHSEQSERWRHQLNASEPLKKQLWKQTVEAKIVNQAQLLEYIGINADCIYAWSKTVQSGDKDNREAHAAAYYWKHIFSMIDFYRRRDGAPPNNLLNYGYAILRAMVARALVSSGMLPTLGIHHRNKYNAYCLADDIMEPYRPYVDLIVLELLEETEDIEELTPLLKQELLRVATLDVILLGKTMPLLNGISRTTASLYDCYSGDSRKIHYPIVQFKMTYG